jgi:uncharacterized protein YerC
MIELTEAFLNLQSQAEVTALLNLLFTPTELKGLNTRWQGCQMAIQGSTQRKMRSSLGMGNSTAARCAKVVRKAEPEFRAFAIRLGILPNPECSKSSVSHDQA